MSFDLSLSKGDLIFGNDGDLRKIRNNSKIIQDVLKELHIYKGSDAFNPQRGVELTADKIGENLNQQFIESKMTADVIEVLNVLISTQERMARYQQLTDAEQIKELQEVSVQRDTTDPRQYNVKIVVLAKDYSEIEIPEFTFVTNLDE